MKIDIDLIFMELGNTAKTDFIKNLIMLNEADEIVIVDTNQSTSWRGLFAPGDVTDTPFKQAITSTELVSALAINILNIKKLKKKKRN